MKGTKHQRTKRHDIKRVVTKAKAPNLLCQNNWDYQWKRRYWSSTRNKSTLWLCYQVKFFIISIYFKFILIFFTGGGT